MTGNYRAAYERQKLARAKSDQLLEERSRELYESNEALKRAYESLKDQKNQLYHQEKLASIGLLGAGVAHEINNPAGFIRSNLSTQKNYIQSFIEYMSILEGIIENSCNAEVLSTTVELKKELDLEYILDDIVELTDESLDGIERIEKIVRSLKDFSRPDAIENQNFDLNKCVITTLNLLENQTKYKTEVVTQFADIPFICGQPGGISQVILNIVVNATHAIKEFGKITIKTSVMDKYAILEIEDNGCGIPKESLKTIFDPFFTTKPQDQGTGLGLSISHGIIKQHGGSIFVESTVGEGTKFTIRLPLGECQA